MAMPEALARLRVPLGFATAAVYLALARPTLTSFALALPLVGAGLGLRVWASGHIVKGTELTTSGPYARLRHPLYAGSALLALGFAVASGSVWVGLSLACAFALVYTPVARREERMLRERFGPAHDAWSVAVPALLPRLRPWSGAEPGRRFSWISVRRHRELRAAAGAVALLALLAVRALSRH